jgi:hypothetical protein
MLGTIVDFLRRKYTKKTAEKYATFVKTLEEWKTPELARNMTEYYHNSILFMTKVFPSVIASSGARTVKPSVPKHWDLEENHNTMVEEIVANFGGIYALNVRAQFMMPVLDKIRELYKDVELFLRGILTFVDVGMRVLLYKFLWYSVLCDYIRISTEHRIASTGRRPTSKGRKNSRTARVKVPTTMTLVSPEDDAAEIMTENEDEHFAREYTIIEEETAHYLDIVLGFFMEQKTSLNQSYNEFFEKKMAAVIKEKEAMKKFFNAMDNEERKLEMSRRKLKLGFWGEAATNVFKYDKKQFEKETQRLVAEAAFGEMEDQVEEDRRMVFKARGDDGGADIDNPMYEDERVAREDEAAPDGRNGMRIDLDIPTENGDNDDGLGAGLDEDEYGTIDVYGDFE